MSNDKMREAFEVECSIWSSNYAKKDKNGNYLDMTVHSKWVTWQVAWQAALSQQPEPAATQFRYQDPFTAWVVFDPETGPVYACESRTEANDHIADAIDRGVDGAESWQFRKLTEEGDHPASQNLGVREWIEGVVKDVLQPISYREEGGLGAIAEGYGGCSVALLAEKPSAQVPAKQVLPEGAGSIGSLTAKWVEGWNDCRAAMLAVPSKAERRGGEQ